MKKIFFFLLQNRKSDMLGIFFASFIPMLNEPVPTLVSGFATKPTFVPIGIRHIRNLCKRMFIKYIFLLFLISSVGFSQSTDQNISNTAFSDTEPFIAVNPANTSNLIAAWMSSGRIKTKRSLDGGLTWGNENILPHFSGNTFQFASADPSITFNNSGTAFLSYVDYKYFTLDTGYVLVARSTDGGATWSAPVIAIDGLGQPDFPIDRPWIVCDQTTGAFSGRIYLTSMNAYFSTGPHKIWLSISSDTGKTFSPIMRVDTPITVGTLDVIMGVPAVGADGSLYIAYYSWDTNFSPFVRGMVSKSTNGGATFMQYPIFIPVAGSAITDTLYQGSYSIAANPVLPNNLIFQFTDARYGDPDILALFSSDGGITWSSNPVRINDDVVNNGKGQDMSWAGFSPGGIYAVAWRDRRNFGNTDTTRFEIFASVSADGGMSFSANFKISSQSSNFINMTKGNDFLGVCLNTDTLFVNWGDQRTLGNNEIYTRFIPLSQILSAEENPEKTLELQVIPNPNKGIFFLEAGYETCKEYKIEIYNIFGQKINFLSKNEGNKIFLLMNSPAEGMHLVGLVQNDVIIAAQKFLITK